MKFPFPFFFMSVDESNNSGCRSATSTGQQRHDSVKEKESDVGGDGVVVESCGDDVEETEDIRMDGDVIELREDLINGGDRDRNKNGKINGFRKTETISNGLYAPPAGSNSAKQKKNGTTRSSGHQKAGVDEDSRRNGGTTGGNNDDSTAPEVTHWTEIMSRGWDDDSMVATTTAVVSTKPPIWDCKVLTEYDLQQIEQYWIRLLPTVNYLGTEQVAKIYRALCVAYRAHRGQMRKSGEPFIIHPVEVALLLGNLKMDGETVMAGLLHDTVEDTELTFGQIETLFGATVRGIVEGETKVSKLPKLAFTDYADEQAENLRQMFVAMTDDYRIIIVSYFLAFKR